MTKVTRKAIPAGPRALRGSEPARRAAIVLLESLSGLCTTLEASERLGVALPRYYVLETRALQAMIGALEPRPCGRTQTAAHELDALQKVNHRLTRELRRWQALHRASERALGLPERSKATGKDDGKKQHRVRKKSRAERVLDVLRMEPGAEGGSIALADPGAGDGGRATEQGSRAR